MKLLTGNSNKILSKNIAKYLRTKLVNSSIRKFSDGEIYIEINENIRGNSIFIIQSISSPANDNLMELLVMADAFRRSSASRITAVTPYFGYARQDRRVRSARVPISAKIVADMLNIAGINRVLTVDLHSETIQGFFDIPADNVYATKIMHDDIQNNFKKKSLTVVSPDVGGVVRARALAKFLKDADLAIIDKRRQKANQSEVMNIIGEIEGKICILPDDIIDTAGTVCNAAKALKDAGAMSVYAYITHPVLSGPALERINESHIDELVVTNSIEPSQEVQKCSKIRTISLAPTLAECIRRLNNEESLSALFL